MSATEITAHDVETAIKIGLAQLNLLRAEVKIEVVDEGSKGVLGIGARPARVRLTPFVETEAKESPIETEMESGDTAQNVPEVAENAEPETVMPAATLEGAALEAASQDEAVEEQPGEETEQPLSEESEQLAGTLTQGVLDRMNFQATCTSRLIEPKPGDHEATIWVDIQGKDASRLLAHQCEALDALQLVVQTMWAHQTKSGLRVTLDADSYKERRERRIAQMAERLAERVVSSGHSITLEPMPASERRLVHIALREHPQVTTESHGEGTGRRITIRLK